LVTKIHLQIIETIEDEEKKDFEKNRPPGTTNKPLRRRLTNIILSFLSAYYQSSQQFWQANKQITDEDLTGIAAAIRAQIIVSFLATLLFNLLVLAGQSHCYQPC
jgi:hypothetical protein